MNEFLLIFRNEKRNEYPIPLSPEQMQAMMKPWQDWLTALSSRQKLVSSGNRLAPEGKVIKANKMTINGPYVEIKESIGGYIIIRASTLEEAADLSLDCPIFNMGGNVEIRPIVPME